MRPRSLLVAVTGLTLVASLLPAPSIAAAPIQVILDGKALSLAAAPVIQNDRTLVPLRGIFEALGVSPHWDATSRSVEAQRGSRYVKLWIDRRLACLSPTCADAATLDVPATIIDNRTYVPVRFISTALGARVTWDDARRAVVIETDKPPVSTAPPVSLSGVSAGQQISGPVSLKAVGATGSQVFFYLIDPATRRGRLIAAGTDPAGTYSFTPDPTQAGLRHIVAAVRDGAGTLRYSDPVPVSVSPNTKPRVNGLTPGTVITGPITFNHEIQFVSSSVTYQLVDPAGNATDLATVGPGDPFTWYPAVGHNGPKAIRVQAFDRSLKEYLSDPVPVTVASEHRTVFASIAEGETYTRPRSLTVSANYPIKSVRFLLNGQVLAEQNNFWWSFGPERNGSHTLLVEVTDQAGTVRTVGPIRFTINATPSIWLTGVGPKQVVTETVNLKATANMNITAVRFYLREGSGPDILLGERKPGEALPWKPASGGQKTLYAQGWHNGQWVVSGEPITVQAYLGTVHKARPIVAKEQFQSWVSPMAVRSHQETGMSAALQVAQAILETGWGQFVPVDKYSGQFSHNLFGIKGKGSAGSIISTTWEVYNGVSYTVDDYFRAYRSVDESWTDHKDLLLTRSWYAPFRAVMADPLLGAWGLRRSGYATDPQYPIKLINLMRQHDLFKLDEVEL